MQKRKLFINALAEFAPIVTFVIAAELTGFLQAVLWLIFAAFLSLTIEWYVAKRIPKFGIVASGIILLFGGMSIVTGNEFFIIIKDTLYALSFSLALLIGVVYKRSYLKVLFGDFFAVVGRF